MASRRKETSLDQEATVDARRKDKETEQARIKIRGKMIALKTLLHLEVLFAF
jgi:hypothetical protein